MEKKHAHLPWGLIWGFLGVLAFSFTVPFTRVAVAGLSPLFIGAGRAVVAAALAAIVLALAKQHLPNGRQLARLSIVVLGVVIGFPMLTTYALTEVPATHGAVVIAILPAATAVMAVVRGHERPPLSFWIFAALGTIVALIFAAIQGGGFGELGWADVLLFGAVIAAAIGYAEGGMLSRELGSWQTISWALVLASPIMIVLTVISIVVEPPHATNIEWAAFAYLGVISMFLGFFAWYRGLAIGPIAQVGQTQLVQPVLSILWAALILREALTLQTVIGGLAVILFAGLAVRIRAQRKAPLPQ